MAFEYWDSLSDDKKLDIAVKAQEAQDKTGHRTCYWCGTKLDQGYDYTLLTRSRRKICKGFCKKRRFFDNPDEVKNWGGEQHHEKTYV